MKHWKIVLKLHKRGFNFVMTPKHIPTEDVVSKGEAAITHLPYQFVPYEQAVDIRQDTHPS